MRPRFLMAMAIPMLLTFERLERIGMLKRDNRCDTCGSTLMGNGKCHVCAQARQAMPAQPLTAPSKAALAAARAKGRAMRKGRK